MRLTQAAESGEKERRETGARAAATPSRSCAAMNARAQTHTSALGLGLVRVVNTTHEHEISRHDKTTKEVQTQSSWVSCAPW